MQAEQLLAESYLKKKICKWILLYTQLILIYM